MTAPDRPPGAPADAPAADLREEHLIVPVVVERLHVDTRVREVGRVRLVKQVDARDAPIDLDYVRDHVAVERVPVGRPVEAPEPVRFEGDTMIIPVHEEVLVVQKQLVVREELRVRVDRVTSHEQGSVRLRSEAVTITHTSPNTQETPP